MGLRAARCKPAIPDHYSVAKWFIAFRLPSGIDGPFGGDLVFAASALLRKGALKEPCADISPDITWRLFDISPVISVAPTGASLARYGSLEGACASGVLDPEARQTVQGRVRLVSRGRLQEDRKASTRVRSGARGAVGEDREAVRLAVGACSIRGISSSSYCVCSTRSHDTATRSSRKSK